MAERAKTPPPLRKTLKFPSFAKKRRHQGPATAIDVDGALLRVVVTAPRGNRIAVTRIAAEKLDLPESADRSDPAVLGAAIGKAMERLRLKSSPVVMGVPRASVVLRTLTVPVLKDLRELASVVHFQMGRDLPFRADTAVIDFKVRRQINPPVRVEVGAKAPESPDGKAEPAPTPKLEVLVAAARRDVVEFYQQTAAAAGLKLAGLGLLSNANARCVEACRVAEGNESVALVSLRSDEVGIDVVAQQSLLFSRGVVIKARPDPLAAPDDLAAEPAAAPPEPAAAASDAAPPEKQETFVDAVTIEVVRTLHSYGGLDPQSPVSKLVVVGTTGHEPSLVELLHYKLSIPCTWLDVAGTLELPKAAREHAAGSVSTIGLGLGISDSQGLPFDFLNPKRPAVQRNVRRTRILIGAAAAAAALIFLMGLQSSLIKQRLRLKQAVQEELTQATSKQKLYRQTIEQAKVIRDWQQGGRNWLEHYAYLSAVLPASEEIYLNSFTVTGQGGIRLAVQARSGETLAKLDKQLRAAGYEVKPLAINPGTDKFGYEFRSTVELTVPEKMKFDLSKVRPPPRPADDVSLEPTAYRKGGRS